MICWDCEWAWRNSILYLQRHFSFQLVKAINADSSLLINENRWIYSKYQSFLFKNNKNQWRQKTWTSEKALAVTFVVKGIERMLSNSFLCFYSSLVLVSSSVSIFLWRISLLKRLLLMFRCWLVVERTKVAFAHFLPLTTSGCCCHLHPA